MIRALVAAAAALVLAGCSEASPSASKSATPAATSPAADGPRISGTGYSYHVPQGWDASPEDIPGFDLDSVAFDLEDKDAFTDNVNVILSPAGEITPEQAEQTAQDELLTVGANDISVHDRVTIAGAESAHVSADMSLNDNLYTIEQFYPVDGGQTYVVTFSFSRSVSADDRAEITGPTLASWVWAA